MVVALFIFLTHVFVTCDYENTKEMEVPAKVMKRLNKMSVYEIVEMEGIFVLNIGWLHWNSRPGSHAQK